MRYDIDLPEGMHFKRGHFWFIGQSGYGKTKAMERMCRTLIKRGHSVCVLDGKGELYQLIKEFCCYWMVPQENVCLIDPSSRTDRVPGYNLLEPVGGTSPVTIAEIVTEAMIRAFRENEEGAVWLKEWGPAVLAPLAAAGLTIAEAPRFISDHTFRSAVLQKAGLEYYTEKWEGFVRETSAFEKANILRSLSTRLDRLLRNPWLSAMTGQRETTINIRRWLEDSEQHILLANLGESGHASRQALQLLGALLLHRINLEARRPDRNPDPDNPAFVFVDEAQKFCSSDIADALDQLRHFQVFFLIANQRIEQFNRHDPDTVSALMTNTDNKIVFKVSRADAELLYGEIFAGSIHTKMREVKDEIVTVSPWPVDLWVEIVSTTEVVTEGESYTETSNSSFSEFESEGTSESEYEGWLEPGDELGLLVASSHENMEKHMGKSSGKIVSKGTSRSDSSGESYTFSRVKTKGKTVTPTMITKHVPFSQVTSRTFYTEADVREEYIAALMKQDPRHCVLKVGAAPPTSALIPIVKPIRLLVSELEEYEQSIYNLTCRSVKEIREQMHARRLISKDNPKIPEDDIELYEDINEDE